MFTEKNFKSAVEFMNFEKISDGVYQKNLLKVDFNQKKFFYPQNLKVHRDSIKNFSQNENFVVFECVNRLLEKNYKPEDIEIEKPYPLGHLPKSGRSDICVSHNQKTLFIIECKTFGAEFEKELKNLKSYGGQLFSYWQQDKNAQWLMLYASTFDDELKFSAKSFYCDAETYKTSNTVPEKFETWKKIQQPLFDDVIFHEDTVSYKIGVKPLRKKNLKDFPNTSIVNIYEEILRHNSITNTQTAFDALSDLFICKLADESHKDFNDEVEFQFKFGSDNFETFIDRLQKLYHQGMEEFMRIQTTYTPLSFIENLLKQSKGENRKNLEISFKEKFNELKFYTPNIFNFIRVLNREIFYINGKIVREVVEEFKDYKIIGAKNLQILGDLFEQLLDKGFKQNEGMFFTPLPITRFIWNSLPLEKIISAEKNFVLPKIIDYACGAGHFLTQGFEAINDFFAQKNISPPTYWESEKLFGIERDFRLSTVSKVSLFMHGANKGNIKWGNGLENYSSEGFTPNTFDILVSNPPYAIKNFAQFLDIENKFETLEKISNVGKEIETLFVERISQLLKPGGIAAVILPSSILNKDGGSFTSAREIILKNFYIRAIAEFGSKTFSETGTKTNILFLEKISDPPQKFKLYADTVNEIFSQNFSDKWTDEEIFVAWLKKIKVTEEIYKNFIHREKNFSGWADDSYFGEYVSTFKNSSEYKNKISQVTFKNLSDAEKLSWLNQKFYDFAHEIEREKIQYFAQTFEQKTLIISAPDNNSEQEKFLGYSWSNRKGDEGIKIKSAGLMFKLTEAIKKSFFGEEVQIPDAKNYFNYFNLSDLIDFSGTNFTKIIKLTKKVETTYSGNFPLKNLKDTAIKPLEYGSGTAATDFDGEIRYIRITDINDNGGLNKNLVSPEKFDEKFILNDGDILFARSGATVGKTFLYKKNFGKAIFAGYLIRYVANPEIILPEYVFQFTRTDIYKNFVENTKKGMTQPNINAQDYGNLKIPVPTLEEQKKIIGEFTELDEKILQCEEKISASDLAIKNKFSEMFGGIEEKISIGECCEIEKGDNLTREQAIEGNVPVVAGGILPSCYHNVANREKNIISVSASGKNAGYVNFWREPIFATDCNTLKNKKNFVIEYIYYALKNIQEKIFELQRGSAQPHVYGEDLKKILIPVPPKEKQEKFAEFVLRAEEEKNSAKNLREKYLSERESLVEKYFR